MRKSLITLLDYISRADGGIDITLYVAGATLVVSIALDPCPIDPRLDSDDVDPALVTAWEDGDVWTITVSRVRTCSMGEAHLEVIETVAGFWGWDFAVESAPEVALDALITLSR